ncbi:UDP-glucose--hexose-1-phosphate uridylyltransferase [Aeromicrobium ponti]|uniref:Galactose-1-phosphate uridylyltransferase n=1 Tax=Cytobacillus oceanisediminis TaxID=665099 RepID=A0A562J8P4_9BACI|nr:UDP-glucose--hexose-1-phosphate uridylyltransferase [Cytobacillus oceanisediminis]TWH79264.1 UTP-hexose-1-phosphate uridylyltransferase [Cytobacillus oceanisediminis]
MATIYQELENLLEYGLKEKLFEKEDKVYVRNRIMAVLKLDEWEDRTPSVQIASLSRTLNSILDWAYKNGLIETNTITERDILETEIMNCLIPRPSEVIREFYNKYEQGPKEATDYYYHLSTASNYIRTDRIQKNKQWRAETPYGEIDITINLSKPEKDPKEIAMMKNVPPSSYPACLLCRENEGYRGTLRHPARGTHRIIPVKLNGEDWFFQYSPYVYYNEHSIVFRKEHVPMKISEDTFRRLLDFIEAFPHYFIGSNADLPIVGGSILSHDHFQSGQYTFALERAETAEIIRLRNFPTVTIGRVNWPMSVLRVQGSKEEVAEVSNIIFQTWQNYSDPPAEIHAHTGRTPHNTVTPIARKRGKLFEMDVVLRNNRTSEEFPDGIFHPHQELHHIKKENIGLIEVMGLAVLPGRLSDELNNLAMYLLNPIEKSMWGQDMLKHWEWYCDIRRKYSQPTEDNVMEMIKCEIGQKFQTVLEHAGVYKQTDEGLIAFKRFLDALENNNHLKGISG